MRPARFRQLTNRSRSGAGRSRTDAADQGNGHPGDGRPGPVAPAGAARARRRRRARAVGAGIGTLRVLVGVLAITRPEALPRSLGIDSVSARRVDWLARMLGARDVALGAGGAHAALAGRTCLPWLLAQAAADGVDAAAIGLAARRRQVLTWPGVGTAAVAAAAALGALLAAVDADAGPPPGARPDDRAVA